jgi:ABC-type hemin transport system ATPase subunit
MNYPRVAIVALTHSSAQDGHIQVVGHGRRVEDEFSASGRSGVTRHQLQGVHQQQGQRRQQELVGGRHNRFEECTVLTQKWPPTDVRWRQNKQITLVAGGGS